MSRISQPRLFSRTLTKARKVAPFAALPIGLLLILNVVAFRQTPVISVLDASQQDPLQLPAGWSNIVVPADNPITAEKFTLGRYLFFEKALSGDSKTSCGSCHNPRFSFSSSGIQSGAFGDSSRPGRMAPRLMNLGYDSVYTWDGHLKTLEQQVHIAVIKKGDLRADTIRAFNRLSQNPAYPVLFRKAFGDESITLDRVAKAIATFERCLISGDSPYDRYLNGETIALSQAAIAGMKLFFDTTATHCARCHNSEPGASYKAAGQLFTDNNYYRTGTFEPTDPAHGYGFDPKDTLLPTLDAGRAAVTRDTADIGKFRTPSLRNVALTGPYGAAGTAGTLREVLENYNLGMNSKRMRVPNQDPRIKPLNLTMTQLDQLEAFLNSLTDHTFISNPAFQDPGAPTARVDDRIVSANVSLYPNPATGPVNVLCPDMTGQVEARLVSSTGAVVWHLSVNANEGLHFDFSQIANGAYRLDLESANVRHAVAIVLQH